MFNISVKKKLFGSDIEVATRYATKQGIWGPVMQAITFNSIEETMGWWDDNYKKLMADKNILPDTVSLNRIECTHVSELSNDGLTRGKRADLTHIAEMINNLYKKAGEIINESGNKENAAKFFNEMLAPVAIRSDEAEDHEENHEEDAGDCDDPAPEPEDQEETDEDILRRKLGNLITLIGHDLIEHNLFGHGATDSDSEGDPSLFNSYGIPSVGVGFSISDKELEILKRMFGAEDE